jgi:hypothetical protein
METTEELPKKRCYEASDPVEFSNRADVASFNRPPSSDAPHCSAHILPMVSRQRSSVLFSTNSRHRFRSAGQSSFASAMHSIIAASPAGFPDGVTLKISDFCRFF